jgi:hypothetical protein
VKTVAVPDPDQGLTSEQPAGPGATDRPAAGTALRVLRAAWPLPAMAVVGLTLSWFLVLSTYHRVPFGRFHHPPIYGAWSPAFTTSALIVIPGALALWAIAVAMTTWRRFPTWLALALLIVAGVATAALVTMSRGESHGPVKRLQQGFTTYYTADMHVVDQFGVRGFDQHFHQLSHGFSAYNSQTHPPGPVVLLHTLFSAFGPSHLLPIATVLAVLGMAAAIPAWLIGHELGGARAGRIAAVLFVSAPGPLLLAFVSMDAVYATGLSAATSLFVLAISRRSVRLAAGGGVALGVTAYLTYAVSFVAVAFVIAALLTLRAPGPVARLLGAAAVGGIAVLAVERLALGYDLLASYASVPSAGRAYDPYWIAGAPAAMLVVAGLPLATLGVIGLVRRVPGGSYSFLPVVLVSLMVVWGALPASITHLRPGEVERTWAFLYPLLAATAAPLVDRWTRKTRWSPLALALLIGLSVAQATVIELLWVTVH